LADLPLLDDTLQYAWTTLRVILVDCLAAVLVLELTLSSTWLSPWAVSWQM